TDNRLRVRAMRRLRMSHGVASAAATRPAKSNTHSRGSVGSLWPFPTAGANEGVAFTSAAVGKEGAGSAVVDAIGGGGEAETSSLGRILRRTSATVGRDRGRGGATAGSGAEVKTAGAGTGGDAGATT